VRGDEFIRVPGDRSTRVTWKNFPFILLFVGFLIFITTADGDARAIGKRVLATVGLAVPLVVLAVIAILVFRGKPIRPNPANRVARLLREGRVDEACDAGMALVAEHPDDAMLQINCAVALHQAGRVDEARRAFNAIDPDTVPSFFRPAYQDWERVLKA
jgi:hypothetical protein